MGEALARGLTLPETFKKDAVASMYYENDEDGKHANINKDFAFGFGGQSHFVDAQADKQHYDHKCQHGKGLYYLVYEGCQDAIAQSGQLKV